MLRILIAGSACCLLGILIDCSQAVEPQAGAAIRGIDVDPLDWPWWRGPHRNGVAPAGQNPPVSWSATKNVVWSTPLPGMGHGSPTVVADKVFLATADADSQEQSVLCLDRQTGKQLWRTVVHHSKREKKTNKKASQASSTLAFDGERVFINFLSNGAVYTTALDLDGTQIWQTKITDYVLHQGYGSSPAIYQHLVIVSADNKQGGAVAGLDRSDGKIVWRNARPKTPNYPSPIILHASGRDQVVLTGCNRISSFDPLTGEQLWEVPGATTECVTSTVTDGELVYSSGGFPANHMSAVKADGSGELVWSNKNRVYVPSMLVKDGYLYAVLDAGIAMCWQAATGDEKWKQRLGGTFSASPILVGDSIYVTNESGKTFIFRADPSGFQAVGENQLGDHVMATPVFTRDRIYMRVAQQSGGRRQEMLYCLGNSASD